MWITRPGVAFAFAVAVVLASLGVAGCSKAGETPEAKTARVSAEKVASERCAFCHSAKKALAFEGSDPSAATRLLDDMVFRGASITPAERKALMDYFTR